MFMITPKASRKLASTDTQLLPTQPSRPIAKIGRVRAVKACDRCRMKKIKCDGIAPCLRCEQDEVICIIGKKEATDSKAASRDYILSLEAQQKSLIQTLRQIQLHTPQAIDSDGMKVILDAVKAHGYEFQNLNSETGQELGTTGSEGLDETGHLSNKKRKHALESVVGQAELYPPEIPQSGNRTISEAELSNQQTHLPRLDAVQAIADAPSFQFPGQAMSVDPNWNAQMQYGNRGQPVHSTYCPPHPDSTLTSNALDSYIWNPDHVSWSSDSNLLFGQNLQNTGPCLADWNTGQDASTLHQNNVDGSLLWWDPSLIISGEIAQAGQSPTTSLHS